MRVFWRPRRMDCRRCVRRRWVRMVRFSRPPGYYPVGPGVLFVPGHWTVLCRRCIRFYRRSGQFPRDGHLPFLYDEMAWGERG